MPSKSQTKSPKPRQSITRDHLIELFVLLGIILTASWLMLHTLKYNNGVIIIASKLYSDFGAHIPLVRSFSYGGNFPVEYPTFPGEPIRYHYLFYLIAGGLESIGFSISAAINLISVIGFALLLWMIYVTSKDIFHSKKVGLLAIMLFLFNGTLSFIEFFHQYPLSLSTLKDILTAEHFVSFGPWDGKLVSAFWNLNIYTNQRHLGLSFGLGLFLLYPFINLMFNQKKPTPIQIMLMAIVMLIMPWLNQAVFAMVVIVTTGLVILNLKQIKSFLPLFLVLFLASIPGILLRPLPDTNIIVQHLGFLSQDNTLIGILTYWAYNLGIYLILIPIVFIWTNLSGKKLILSLLPLFIITNVVKLSPDIINNHKLINFFMIFVVIMSAGFLVALWKKHILLKPVVIITVFTLTLSGIIDLFPIINDRYIHVDDFPKAQAISYIKDQTPKNTTFLTTTYLYNPASLAGRKTFVDYGYFNWSMGHNDKPRRYLLPDLFSSTIEINSLCQLLTTNQLDYVIIAPGKGNIDEIDPHMSQIKNTFKPSYQSPDGYHIYDVQENCSQIKNL